MCNDNPNNPLMANSILTAKASEELEEEVEKELQLPDPTPEQARAILNSPEKGKSEFNE